MKWSKQVIGIPDEQFIRGKVPMTKREIRVLSLSKLELKETGSVLDIGCGSGSVSVECAHVCTRGQVVCMDEDEEAIRVTKENIKKFQLKNVTLIEGSAPKCLPDETFDHIFLGGGSKQIEPIIDYCFTHLETGGSFVANTILVESTYKILHALEKRGFREIDCTLLQVSKGEMKTRWMMKGFNPIYIIYAKR